MYKKKYKYMLLFFVIFSIYCNYNDEIYSTSHLINNNNDI